MKDPIHDELLAPWWRYTWRQDGSVSTVERVEGGRQEDGRFVGYVRAHTKEEATIAAKRLIDKWARRAADALARAKNRTDRRREEGLCIRCGREHIAEPFTSCEKCRDRVAERAKITRNGGERLIARAATNEAEQLAAQQRYNAAARARRIQADTVVPSNAYVRACVTLKTLKTVLWQMDRKDPNELRKWLLAAIEEERSVIFKRNEAMRGVSARPTAAE